MSHLSQPTSLHTAPTTVIATASSTSPSSSPTTVSTSISRPPTPLTSDSATAFQPAHKTNPQSSNFGAHHTAFVPRHRFREERGSHKLDSSALFGREIAPPLLSSPPPKSPLPPVPSPRERGESQQEPSDVSQLPPRPRLHPKRGPSRSPSPLARGSIGASRGRLGFAEDEKQGQKTEEADVALQNSSPPSPPPSHRFSLHHQPRQRQETVVTNQDRMVDNDSIGSLGEILLKAPSSQRQTPVSWSGSGRTNPAEEHKRVFDMNSFRIQGHDFVEETSHGRNSLNKGPSLSPSATQFQFPVPPRQSSHPLTSSNIFQAGNPLPSSSSSPLSKNRTQSFEKRRTGLGGAHVTSATSPTTFTPSRQNQQLPYSLSSKDDDTAMVEGSSCDGRRFDFHHNPGRIEEAEEDMMADRLHDGKTTQNDVNDSYAGNPFKNSIASRLGGQSESDGENAGLVSYAVEPAWSDDASCIDGVYGGEEAQMSASSSPRQMEKKEQLAKRFNHESQTSSRPGGPREEPALHKASFLPNLQQESDSGSQEEQEERDHVLKPRRGSGQAETFEIAALRRQVEQLQMALRRQMDSGGSSQQHNSHRLPQQANSNYKPHLGLPTPTDSRAASMISGAKRSPTSTEHGREIRAPFEAHLQHDEGGMSQWYAGNGAFGSRAPGGRSRVTSDPPTTSSIFIDESASQFTRAPTAISGMLDDGRVEELAKKIEALEDMFRTAATLSPVGSHTTEYQQQLSDHEAGGLARPASIDAGRSLSRGEHNHPSGQRLRQEYTGEGANIPSSAGPNRSFPSRSLAPARSPSLSTISTREGVMSAASGGYSTYGRTRSPAASAYHFNATPYAREGGPGNHSALALPTSSVDVGSSSASSQPTKKKGVARFIMGASVSRKTSAGSDPSLDERNYQRHDHQGDQQPKTMQVSWSRKRMEKVEKPPTRVKAGPGRGRMVVQTKNN